MSSFAVVLLPPFLILQIHLNSLTMKKQTEYIIVVNGRPFFSVLAPSSVSVIENEAIRRFGPAAKIEVFAQITEPYESSSSTNDSE